MNKSTKLILIICSVAGTLFLSACNNTKEDVWGTSSETPSYNQGKTMTRAQKKAHLDYVLSKVVLIKMDDKGTLELSGDILTQEEFSSRIRIQGEATPGKPVLFYYEPSYTKNNTKTISFVVKECRTAGLGRIYRDIPEKL